MRWLGVLLASLVCTGTSHAYIDRAPWLSQVIEGSQHILVLQVDKVNHEKRVICFKKVADLKGTYPGKEMRQQLSDGLHPREPKIILSWAEPGATAICFLQGNTAQICIGQYWYECVGGAAPWWTMAYGRPELSCAYIGSAAKLRDHVAAIVAGKDVVVTAVARWDWDWDWDCDWWVRDEDNANWAAHGEVYARHMMRNKECRLWRIKPNGEKVGRGPRAAEEVPGLVRALQDQDESTRAEAAADLGLMGWQARRSLPALRKALQDPAPRVRVRAAEAVARVDPDPRAPGLVVPVLVAALQDKRAKIRQAAADSLWVMGPDAQAAVPALATLLGDQDPYVRWAALETLGQIGCGAEAAVPALVKMLKDGDLCGSAAQALGHIGAGARAAVPSLLQEFQAVHADTQRLSVALALIRIDPQAARVTVPFLIDRVQKNHDRISLEAIQALMAMGPEAKDAIPALTELVRANRVALSSWSACALARIAGPQANIAIPHVLELVGYDEIFGTSELLAQLGPAAVPAILDAARGANRHRAGRVLGLIGCKFPEVIPTLIKALEDKNAGPRQAASEAFWRIGARGRDAVPALTKALQDGDVMVQHGAAWALVHILGSEATASVPTLMALAGNAENDRNVRRSAILGLGAVGSAAKEGAALLTVLEKDSFFHVAALRSRLLVTGAQAQKVVRVLVQALKEENPWSRREAAGFLAELGPVARSALPALTAALDDEDEQVCKAVVNAWRRVGPARHVEMGPAIVCVLMAAVFFGLASRSESLRAARSHSRYGAHAESLPLSQQEFVRTIHPETIQESSASLAAA